jgi:hypothetical protein
MKNASIQPIIGFRLALGCIAFFVACGITAVASAQATTNRTIRVVCYNIMDDINGFTTPLAGLIAPFGGGGFTEFSSGTVTNGGVLEGIGEEIVGTDPAQPIDILALEETTSNTTTVQPIVNALNTFYSQSNPSASNMYAMSAYQATEEGGIITNGNGPNAMVYNTTTLQLVASVSVDPPGGTSHLGSASGEYREVMRYLFAPAGVTPTTTNEFYMYVSHYKAKQEVSDEVLRQGEATIIRTNSATLPSNARILYVGDYNVSSNNEPAFQTIVAPGINQGIDPLNPTNVNPEQWDLNSMLSLKSETATALEWRFDIQIMTSNVYYGLPGGLAYVPGTYHIFGNNGTTPYEKSVNNGSNTALNSDLAPGSTITAAQLYQYLTGASDHLPMVADYSIPIPVQTTNASSFLVTSIVQTNSSDIFVMWATTGGTTNVVQVNPGDVNGSYTTNFTDLSSDIIIQGSGNISTNYLDAGGATNFPSRYYRIRLQP